MFSRPAATDVSIQPFRLCDQFKPAIDIAGGLRAAQQENATLAQREMEHRDHFRLCLGAQIDQQIAA